ncbi:Retrovirus-related Pol polyprotein from transposon RE1 [Cardamine amara subsp. amara]|uniref:Retrovirus-related Pol polyprotein from transposon RE1 n=1 Tax=Cardamine amara subsp. amara TaxID=228776 RepID=A0ABD1C8D6_CARAN
MGCLRLLSLTSRRVPQMYLWYKGVKSLRNPSKGKGKGKADQVVNRDKPAPPPKPKAGPSKDDKCHFCKEPGHWKRNCKKFLEGFKNLKKAYETTSPGIYVIEVNVTSSVSTSWVLDTGCGAHICTNMQALSNKRKVEKGQVELRVGNGARVAALAVGTYHLSLPSGLVLDLHNCYYVPAISRNIISVSCLDLDGFDFSIKNKCCSFN